MTDQEMLESAKTLIARYSEGYVPGPAGLAAVSGAEGKDAMTIAWMVIKAIGYNWIGETKPSTFSRKREDREYLVYKLTH